MTAPQFGAAVAEQYERLMVPLLFAPYARDLAQRVAARTPKRVLEIACGTGAVTRELATLLPPSTAIVATDLHAAMVDRAAAVATTRAIEFQVADVMQLPFADGSFDAVACQFGVMFFPDRVAAYRQMRRVLRPGGRLLFSTWDKLAESEFELAIHETAGQLFPADPPTFFARVPHCYFDPELIRADLAAAELVEPAIETVTRRSRADSAEVAARALCAGSPLRNEIEARDPTALDKVIAAATARLAKQFGTGPVDGKMQALVVEVDR